MQRKAFLCLLRVCVERESVVPGRRFLCTCGLMLALAALVSTSVPVAAQQEAAPAAAQAKSASEAAEERAAAAAQELKKARAERKAARAAAEAARAAEAKKAAAPKAAPAKAAPAKTAPAVTAPKAAPAAATPKAAPATATPAAAAPKAAPATAAPAVAAPATAAPAVAAPAAAPAAATPKAAAVPKAATAPVSSKGAPQGPPPGTVIERNNVEQYAALLGPGMKWAVERGARLRIGPYVKIVDPPPYREATEKFASQVKLSADGVRLENYVAGQPFPVIDKNDPLIAVRVMFNFSTAIGTDDSDIRNFDCDTSSLGKDGNTARVERHFLIDHIRRLYFSGRLVVDPKPEMPNRDSARFKEALYPIIEPFDLKGTGFTFTRYADAARQDDTWLYLPQLRRVRRLSSAQRSDALFGQDTDADSYEGYQGNVAWMAWKYLGEKTILGTMHAEHLPVKWGAPSGDFMHDDLWEPRDVWIVEGVSKLPQYAYSKRVIYLDKEVYRIPFTEMYDSANELWKLWINNYRFAKSPFPGAKYGLDWEYSYRPSITMIDLQLEHGTYCALPSHRFPGEQGWYVDLGDKEGTTETFFDLSSIIAAGR